MGYVYDSKPDGVGTHAVYKFENGSYTSTLSLVTGRPSNDSNWRQIVAVLGVSDNPPFYVIDAVQWPQGSGWSVYLRKPAVIL